MSVLERYNENAGIILPFFHVLLFPHKTKDTTEQGVKVCVDSVSDSFFHLCTHAV